MTPEEEQALLDAGYPPEVIAQIKAAQGGGEEEEVDNTPKVWMPQKKKSVRPKTSGDFLNRGSAPIQSVTGGETNANDVFNWLYDDKQRAKIEDYLGKRGYDWTGFSELAEIWRSAVAEASEAYTTSEGKVKKTPWDILDLNSPTEEAEKKDPWEDAVKGAQFTMSQTNTSIDELDPAAVTMTLKQTLRDLIGREPTTEEIEDFASRAAGIAHENPSITKTETTQKWDPDLQQYIEVESTSETSGGVTGEMIATEAEEDAKQNEEYALYQGSTNVYNAIQSALASPV